MFQSTHPCGVRRHGEIRKRQSFVSIHAPVWGATFFTSRLKMIIHVSIHAPVWGATCCSWFWLRFPKFRSTHPCGVRPVLPVQTTSTTSFQSTHPCGVRPAASGRVKQTIAFQSTHPYGVRLLSNLLTNSSSLFQSTHPCGVRLLCQCLRLGEY